MGFRFQLLPVGHQHRRYLEAVAVVGDVAHRIREEATSSAGGVVQCADEAGVRLEQGIVRVEQQRGSEMHHVAGRHEVLGSFVHLGAEATNQVLVKVAHHPVGYNIRMQVHAREVLADLVEQACLVEADNRIGEVELLEDDASVVRELRHVVLEVLASLCTTQRSQRVAGCVVERVARHLTEDQIQVDAAVPMRLVSGLDIFPRFLQYAFKTAQQRERQDDLTEVRVLEIPPQVLGVLPDEVR